MPNLATLKHFLLNNSWLLQAFGIIVLTLVAHRIKTKLYHRLWHKAKSTTHLWDQALLTGANRPASWFIWAQGLQFAAEVIAHGTGEKSILNLLNTGSTVLMTGLFVWFVVRFINAYEQQYLALSRTRIDPTTLRAVSQILRAAALITAVLSCLQIFGISISGILAVGGVGGIAVAFAAKDLLGNFFGGLMIFLDRPFKVGDWIRSPDKAIEGTVEHIGWRLTRIRTFDKRPLYVPNGVFSNIALENPSRMTNRRIKTLIGVRYDDAPKIAMLLNAIEAMLRAHPEIDTQQTLFVKLVEFGPSSLNILLYTFTKTTNWVDFQSAQQDVFLKIIDLIEQHGAACAFPTTTLHTPEAVPVELHQAIRESS